MVAFVIITESLHSLENKPVNSRRRLARVVGNSVVDLMCSFHHQSGLIPLIAQTRLPCCRAQVTELDSANTRHMVTSECQLNQLMPSQAALPPLDS